MTIKELHYKHVHYSNTSCVALMVTFLRAFVKFRKATISFVMPVRLSLRPSVRSSVRMEQLGSQWTDFH